MATEERTTAERLQSLLNVIPYPGATVTIDADTYQLLVDLHAHFAAADYMLKSDLPRSQGHATEPTPA